MRLGAGFVVLTMMAFIKLNTEKLNEVEPPGRACRSGPAFPASSLRVADVRSRLPALISASSTTSPLLALPPSLDQRDGFALMICGVDSVLP